MVPPHFKSFSAVIREIQAQRSLPSELVRQQCETIWGKYRDSQEILHFETAERILGPGRLVSFDFDAALVRVQLLGESEISELPFEKINDFGAAKYNAPETMGETLLGAFWEAKVTRKYLERIVANSYARLAPEEVDSFQEIARVTEDEIAGLCPLDLEEAEIKRHLCDIIGNPFAQKDWGGEVCDIFCNVRFRRKSVPAAFVLKGKSYARRPLRISDLGKNGDQLVRMFSLPAELFVVQSNGPIDGAVYSQIRAQVAEKLMTNQPVYYLVMDGVQTARLLRAFGKL
jgi:hypothetical protein